MKELRYTLLSDGSSDEVLLPILTWLLKQNGVQCAIQPAWAELRRLREPPKTLVERIQKALELFPCDLLFVHRDAENSPLETRANEIRAAATLAASTTAIPTTLCVIPIRMQEAWLLFDEQIIRRAAGNPHGRAAITLPALEQLEQLPDPKSILHELIRDASGLHGRRRNRMRVNIAARRVVELADDFKPLRNLSAFQALEREIKQTIIAEKWNSYS
jgi:hypothetical protein